jgi:hypothetical protein
LFAAATRRPPRILAPFSRVMVRHLAIHCNQGAAATMRNHLFIMPARGMARYEVADQCRTYCVCKNCVHKNQQPCVFVYDLVAIACLHQGFLTLVFVCDGVCVCV